MRYEGPPPERCADGRREHVVPDDRSNVALTRRTGERGEYVVETARCIVCGAPVERPRRLRPADVPWRKAG